MSNRFRRISGRRGPETAVLATLVFALAGCNYGFEGGGFPPHIRTIYIAPFENETPQFDIDQKIYSRMLDDLPRKLGVRVAGEGAADAILQGSIVRYDDVAQSYRAGDATQPAPAAVAHEIQISISARLVDVRDNVIRWEGQRITGRGQYRPDTESEDIGQTAAIQNIIDQIVDGAQSQW